MITVAVEMTKGPVSPYYTNVDTDDERIARRVAYRALRYGDTLADDSNAEFPVTDEELEEYTTVIECIDTLDAFKPS